MAEENPAGSFVKVVQALVVEVARLNAVIAHTRGLPVEEAVRITKARFVQLLQGYAPFEGEDLAEAEATAEQIARQVYESAG